MWRRVLLLSVICVAACATSPGGGEADVTVAASTSGRTLMLTNLEPNWVAPGSQSLLRVEVPDMPGLQDRAWVSYVGGFFEVALTQDGEVWTGELMLQAPTQLADHRIDVRVPYEGGEAVGHGLLAVSELEACPVGQRRQGGQCHVAFEGGILNEDRRLIAINRHGASRTMAHPRAAYRVGDKLVGCICDAMAVARVEDLVDIDANPGQVIDERNALTPAWTTPYTETMYIKGGLAHCTYMVFDEERSMAMVASRGNLTGPGGLTTWRYPDLDAPAVTAPEPLGLWETDTGFERLTWDGELLYGTQHPNALVVMDIDDAGTITEVGRVHIDGALALWAIAKDGDIVYVSDAGEHLGADNPQLMHKGEEHVLGPTSGRIYTIDVSEPQAPAVLGWTATVGLAKGIALLGDGVVALASGSTGIELLDLANPRSPKHLHIYPTTGFTHGVHADNGLLAAGAWNSVMLFDASERGVLRQLDTEGFVRQQLPPSISSHSAYGGVFGAGFVQLVGDELLVLDWNSILVTGVRLGGAGPRAVLGERTIVANAEKQTPQSFSLRVHNGGRDALWVEGVESDEVHFLEEGLVVPPAGYADVNLKIQPGVTDSSYLVLETNDPEGEERGVHIARVAGNYVPGDEAPTFRVPAINHCDGVAAGEPCDMTPVCFDSREPLAEGRPLLIAFFSSW